MIRYDRIPLIQGLLDYAREKNARFHMPGHRNEENIEELSILKENLYSFDVTEVEGTDNLHYPEEIIARSQALLTRSHGFKGKPILRQRKHGFQLRHDLRTPEKRRDHTCSAELSSEHLSCPLSS